MLFILLRTIISAPKSHRAVVLENLALRHQLDVLGRCPRKPRLDNRDRMPRSPADGINGRDTRRGITCRVINTIKSAYELLLQNLIQPAQVGGDCLLTRCLMPSVLIELDFYFGASLSQFVDQLFCVFERNV